MLADALLVAGLAIAWVDRSRARDQAARARRELEQSTRRLAHEESARAALSRELERAVRLRDLALSPATHATPLAALPDARGASARVLWNTARRELAVVASGLSPTPTDSAFQLWVVDGDTPLPVGVFRPDAEGRVLAMLPWREGVGHAQTFAVTIEPADGSPAPTGKMLLIGAVS